MNSYSLDSFITFCDDMQITEEKMDLRILDGNFNNSITLFHGTSKKLSIIRPTSVNVGNRLSSVRTSSFWTNNFDHAVLWALDWIAMELNIDQYCHDINNVLGNRYYFVLPDLVRVKKWEDGREDEEDILQVFKTELNKNPVYVYQATIPTKYVGRGQCAIDEYTVDIPVKPQKEYKIDFDTASQYIKIIKDDNLFAKLLSKDPFSKDKVSLKERLVFRNPLKVKTQRREIYQSFQ